MIFKAIPQQLIVSKDRHISTFSTLMLLAIFPFSFPALAQQQTNNLTSQPLSKVERVLTPTDYALGTGDQLYIDIFKAKDYSGEYLVLVDGTVSLPLVGRVEVEGLTLSETTDIVSRKYAKYLRVPAVTIVLKKPRPLKIAISGEVDRPGSYEITFKEDLQFPSVTDLLELAGGVTTSADIRQVQIRRFVQGREQVLTANLWEYLQQGKSSQDLTLQDGDTIFVPTVDKIDLTETTQLADANFGIQANDPVKVAVIGEVYRPGTYKVVPETSGDTSKPELPRLTEAITLAGGIKPLADIRHVEVRRLTRTGLQQTINVDLWALLQTGDSSTDVILQKGDTIVIPKAAKLNSTEANVLATASFAPATIRVNVVGEVKKPGVVEVPPNTPLNNALLAAGGFDPERADTDSVELIRLNPDGTVTKREIAVDWAKGINEENNPALRNDDVVVVGRSGTTTATDGLGTILKPLSIFFPFLRLFGF